MNKNKFLKIFSYILSIFLLVVTIINHIYRLNGENFILKPYLVAFCCIIYYLFMQNITKDSPEFNKAKKVILTSFILYSLFEFIVTILI